MKVFPWILMMLICCEVKAQDTAIKNIQTAANNSIAFDTTKKPNSKGWIKGGLVS